MLTEHTMTGDHLESPATENPSSPKRQPGRRTGIALLALATAWIPFPGQAELQEQEGGDPIKITEVEADDTNLSVTWNSVEGDIYDVMITRARRRTSITKWSRF